MASASGVVRQPGPSPSEIDEKAAEWCAAFEPGGARTAAVRLPAAAVRAEDRNMFSGAHVILYSQDADADRAFVQEVLGFPHVDAGGGWLIFKLPPAEVAVHPTDGEPKHEFYLMCDDLDVTLARLANRGVEISQEPSDEGWGVLAAVRMPSGTELPLYQPRHPVAHSLSP
ncbi:VOC family protein [Streptomyces sp. NPDC020681]|uniref:VOC family protein n=1 Tax=Streptomyces sp. NPDC020681 TaxID=3365083 RepID=UPI0037B7C958